MGFEIVAKPWWKRIAALVFGKWYGGQDDRVRVRMVYWRGVWYVVHVRYLTTYAADGLVTCPKCGTQDVEIFHCDHCGHTYARR